MFIYYNDNNIRAATTKTKNAKEPKTCSDQCISRDASKYQRMAKRIKAAVPMMVYFTKFCERFLPSLYQMYKVKYKNDTGTAEYSNAVDFVLSFEISTTKAPISKPPASAFCKNFFSSTSCIVFYLKLEKIVRKFLI